MRGTGRGEERFRSVNELERTVREATAALERSKALESWWPDALAEGVCYVHVERGEAASYHVVATKPSGLSKREPLVLVPKAVWEFAAETTVAQEKVGFGGGSALEKLILGLKIEEAHA